MKNVFAQVANGLIYLHRNGAVHHDIKEENILVSIRNGSSEDSPEVEVVICDFESISIPAIQSEGKPSFSWGPFAANAPSTGSLFELGNVQATSVEDDRWLPGWSPAKTTRQHLPKNYDEVNPWMIDSFLLCRLILGHFASNFTEFVERSRTNAVCVSAEEHRFWKSACLDLFGCEAGSVEEAIPLLEKARSVLLEDTSL